MLRLFRAVLCFGAMTTGFAQSPGVNDLSRHDFLYAGESHERRIFLFRGGKVTWSFDEPEGVNGELSGAFSVSSRGYDHLRLMHPPNHPKLDMHVARPDISLLDNPIWNSLATQHSCFSEGNGLARRYRSEIGPLSGIETPSSSAYDELAALVPAGDVAVLFLRDRSDFPTDWEVVRDGTLVQMVCDRRPDEPKLSQPIELLGPSDFAEMVALAKLTEPGPFRDGTATLGGFVGIRVDGRLGAMAGQRLSPDGFREVSAVCTRPDFRGRGFARALVASVTRSIFDSGEVPFLTSFEANAAAIRVYEEVGFRIRRRFELAVLRPPC